MFIVPLYNGWGSSTFKVVDNENSSKMTIPHREIPDIYHYRETRNGIITNSCSCKRQFVETVKGVHIRRSVGKSEDFINKQPERQILITKYFF